MCAVSNATYIRYCDDELFIEQVSLKQVAEKFGTPCYVYSRAALEENWRSFNQAFAKQTHQVCYAVKANSNIAILNLFARLGSGFDIVSIGELERVVAAGGDTKKTVFSGAGKKSQEIEQAMHQEIYCFNVESEQELIRIHAIAKQCNKKVNVALRINPDINADTHPYIATGLRENKFGIDIAQAVALAQKIITMPALKLIGIAAHIGSQVTSLRPFSEVLDRLLAVYRRLRDFDIELQYIDMGGGMGIRYCDEQPLTMTDYAAMIIEKLREYPVTLLLEPGRVLVADAGVLLTKVEYLKPTAHKNFAIVDAGMNDILRPALYHAWQEIKPVIMRSQEPQLYDVAGPVCESADFLGKDRLLSIIEGDYLAVCDAGAYGFSMSSNYNSRCRAAEILVDGSDVHLIRRRECIADLIASEAILPL